MRMPGFLEGTGAGGVALGPQICGGCFAHLSLFDSQHLKAGNHGLVEWLQPTMKVGDG